MSGPLQDLLGVQDLDLALDQLRHRRDHLPERGELARLSARAEELARQLGEVERERAELAERQAQVESELATVEERSAAIDRRLYGGGAAARDLQAMSTELDHLKTRASGLEDAVLEVLEAAEPLDARITSLQTEAAAVAGERAEVTARLAAAEEEIDRESAETAGRRREAASSVPQGLLETYERLRARLGGIGVARLVGNHCDGCHLTLSAVELDQVRHLPEGEVYTCEQCSRILVP